MSEGALSKAERYREAANRYGELAKQAVAAQCFSMAADLLKWADGPKSEGQDRDGTT
jgi:hypothetical protein